MRTPITWLLPALVALVLSIGGVAPASAAPEIEDYAHYQPATRCQPVAKLGTVLLGRFLVRRYGGSFGGISRGCAGSTSEHTEGRAFDWSLDARSQRGQRVARAFLSDLFATDRWGNDHALARRMGVMYVIWDDHMYAAWDRFERERYLSSGCRSRKRCSASQRHLNHIHVSLTRQAARGQTSWYLPRLIS